MWLCFNSNGALVEPALQHGPAARAGTTNFQIFAYFDGVDLTSNNFATIKLIKPDFNDSSYPLLAMRKVVMKYTQMSGENSSHFTANGGPNSDGNYPGFLFDFSNFSGDQSVAILLDTPGLWRAVITLYNANQVMSTQGTATINVQYGNVVNDGTEISIDELMAAYSAAISSKLDYINAIVTVSNIASANVSDYDNGQVIYDKSERKLYQKVNDSWEIKVDFSQKSILIFYGALPDYTQFEEGQIIFLLSGNDKQFFRRTVSGWEGVFDFTDYYNIDTMDSLLANKSKVVAEGNAAGFLRKLTITNEVNGESVTTEYNVDASAVSDVQANGVSVVNNGIANLTPENLGVVSDVQTNIGQSLLNSNGIFEYYPATTLYVGSAGANNKQTKIKFYDSHEDVVADLMNMSANDFKTLFGIVNAPTNSFQLTLFLKAHSNNYNWYNYYIGFSGTTSSNRKVSEIVQVLRLTPYYFYNPRNGTGRKVYLGGYVSYLYKFKQSAEIVRTTAEDVIDFDSDSLFESIYFMTPEEKTRLDNLTNVYKYAGTKTVAELNSLTVTADMNGYVYNVSDSGTLTTGSVQVIAGDNVSVVWDSTNSTYSWDKLAATSDVSGKADKVANATANDLASLDASGNIADSGLATSNVVTRTTTQTLTGEKHIKVGNENGLENMAVYANDTYLEKPTHIRAGGGQTDNIDCENDYTNFWKTTTFLANIKISSQNDDNNPIMITNFSDGGGKALFYRPVDVNSILFCGGHEIRFDDHLNFTDNTNDHNSILQLYNNDIIGWKTATFKSALNVDGLIYAGGNELRFNDHLSITDNTNNHNEIMRVEGGTIYANKNLRITSMGSDNNSATTKEYVDNKVATIPLTAEDFTIQ